MSVTLITLADVPFTGNPEPENQAQKTKAEGVTAPKSGRNLPGCGVGGGGGGLLIGCRVRKFPTPWLANVSVQRDGSPIPIYRPSVI